jgi:hypothetical protein
MPGVQPPSAVRGRIEAQTSSEGRRRGAEGKVMRAF